MDHSSINPLAAALIFFTLGFWTAMFCYVMYSKFMKWSKGRNK